MTARFYTGSYGHRGEAGILRIQCDPDRDTWDTQLLDTRAECPSYLLLHPNGKILFAVRELTEEGGLYTFMVEGNSLRLISELPTLGKDPCYLSIDSSGRFLFVVNYTGGSIAVFRLDASGIPLEMTQCIKHTGSGPHPVRQASSHPHCAVPVGNAVYACDLGADRLCQYELDRSCGALREVRSIPMPAGCGPRHICVQNDTMYVVGELSSEIFVLPMTDEPAVIQTLSTLPPSFSGENIAAAIHASADGSALFVSNRGDDSIAVFRVLPDGKLTRTDVCKTSGKTPRDFAVFGRHLIVANQDSDTLTALEFDPAQYRLSPVQASAHAVRPTHILKITTDI